MCLVIAPCTCVFTIRACTAKQSVIVTKPQILGRSTVRKAVWANQACSYSANLGPSSQRQVSIIQIQLYGSQSRKQPIMKFLKSSNELLQAMYHTDGEKTVEIHDWFVSFHCLQLGPQANFCPRRSACKNLLIYNKSLGYWYMADLVHNGDVKGQWNKMPVGYFLCCWSLCAHKLGADLFARERCLPFLLKPAWICP